MGMEVMAQSPGDMVIIFKTGKFLGIVPLKTMTVNRSVDVVSEFGTGSHIKYAQVQGKIDFEGDFTLGAWYCSENANPATWDALVQVFLTNDEDEGLGREFNIELHERAGYGGAVGTGNSARSMPGSGPTIINPDDTLIESYERCILKGDGINIPEVGGTITRKYSFTCFRRTYGRSATEAATEFAQWNSETGVA